MKKFEKDHNRFVKIQELLPKYSNKQIAFL